MIEAGRTAGVVEPAAIGLLVDALARRGYRVLGPTVRDGAIVYDDLDSADDLPVGWTDRQDAGTYRIERRDDDALFGYAVGPHSWKRYLFPPRVRLWTARRGADGVPAIEEEPVETAPFAFLGVRACELHAIDIQDRVFIRGAHTDRDYAARRENAFLVAVNCFEPAATCFCTSMGTGPRVDAGYDLALTELLDGEHRFLVEAGSARGEEVFAELETSAVTDDDRRAADASIESAEAHMGRTLDVHDIRDLLLDNLEHPRWEAVASRCLSCSNCTLVCPTCFCSAVEDETDLTGEEAQRSRVWDSCFSVDYSFIHGGSIRPSTRSRYRQWMTHKLATWHDQFGTSGCVGCGRCIAWCPAGIDITEEVAAIRAEEAEHASA
ncbi:MAG TPA: 4Fe-4S dicluster domain-containing protein [Gaiellaceae bacterium]|nr:4Fe-4S dicluster domain-containing protein [Gaiellaceae bacterium]